jgi:chemotaxis protein MotB
MSHGGKFDIKDEEAQEDWLLSYADMITLLMAFFIMLAAISKPDAGQYEQVAAGMAKDIGNRTVDKPIDQMRKELSDVIDSMSTGAEAADVGTDDRGVVLNLDSGAMFSAGAADVKPEMVPLLRELVATLAHPRFQTYRFEIQGHTDDTPVKTAVYPSNFDLAAARALATMRALNGLGLPVERMTIASFGQFAPRVPNRKEDGTALPVNQALNRRVAIHVYPR